MLYELLTDRRDEIVARTRVKVAARSAPRAGHAELEHGVSLFVDQLAETLRCEQTTPTRGTSEEIARGAALHGGELRRAGYTISEVVHDYGDVCQSVTELAMESASPVSADEFKTLNRCLDVAIAEAVTEYSRQRERSIAERGTERMGFFAHEVGNVLSTAILAFSALKTGAVGVGGSTGALLARSLVRLRDLIDRSLAEVRLEAGVYRREFVLMTELMEEVEVVATIEARARGHRLTVGPVEPGVVIEVDRHLIAAALANLVHNAFKFSRPGSLVSLRTATTGDGRVLVEVEDECGGLPADKAADLFIPFAQRSLDRTGLGLGLAIARESVEAHGGEIRVRSVEGKGCIFTVDLSRLSTGATPLSTVPAVTPG